MLGNTLIFILSFRLEWNVFNQCLKHAWNCIALCLKLFVSTCFKRFETGVKLCLDRFETCSKLVVRHCWTCNLNCLKYFEMCLKTFWHLLKLFDTRLTRFDTVTLVSYLLWPVWDFLNIGSVTDCVCFNVSTLRHPIRVPLMWSLFVCPFWLKLVSNLPGMSAQQSGLGELFPPWATRSRRLLATVAALTRMSPLPLPSAKRSSPRPQP